MTQAMTYDSYDSSWTSRSNAPQRLARGLGWFSLALGALELAAPDRLARALGMEGQEKLIRAYGAREALTGLGILTVGDSTPWIWGRVAGDALDMATLAKGLDDDNPKRGNVCVALAAVAGVTLLDVICGRQLAGNGDRESGWVPDYSDRSGFPRPAEEMRGAARDFELPPDLRTPEALRAWG